MSWIMKCPNCGGYMKKDNIEHDKWHCIDCGWKEYIYHLWYIPLVLLMLLSIALFFTACDVAHAKEKKKELSSIVSLAHTIFMKDVNGDEVSIYFSTIEKDRENRIKIFDIVVCLYREFKDEGYNEIPASYPIPPRHTISIEVIQMVGGIGIIIKKGKYERWKLFIDEKAEDISKEVIGKLKEVEI